MNGCARIEPPGPVRASRPPALKVPVPTNCTRCGSSLHGRREKVTEIVVVYLCRCGKRRRVRR